MFGHGLFHHDEAQKAFDEYQDANESRTDQAHPKTAAVAAFLAMKVYEKKREKEGKQPLGLMKEFLAAAAAAEVDKLVEGKAIPEAKARLHREEAKKHACKMAEERYQYEEGLGS